MTYARAVLLSVLAGACAGLAVAEVPAWTWDHVAGADGPLHGAVSGIEDASGCGLTYQTSPPTWWPVGVTCGETDR